ncbi:MAG: 30S ribosomal protein S18 [Chloroflexota bacterium]|nr:30S ribosomal protein S18 [Chloroflexota bacterium]
MSESEERRPAPRDDQQSDRPGGGDRFGRPGGRFGAGAQGGRPEGDGGRGGPRPRRGPGGGGGGRYAPRRKVCQFCVDGIGHVDYKDLPRLRRHIGERGKIEPRRKLGTCARHQRSVTTAIKRARYIGLVPFTTSAGRG